jgi:hypothetical protein
MKMSQASSGGTLYRKRRLFFTRARVPETPLLRQAKPLSMGATIQMTEEEILARAAGITTGPKTHPKEVAEAIAASHRMAGAFTRPADETAEPMPAYAAPLPAKGSRA